MQQPLPPRRHNTPLLVALGAALLAVVVVAVVLMVDRTSEVNGAAHAPASTQQPSSPVAGRDPGGASAQVGDCVNFTSTQLQDTLAEKVDCAAPDAVYEVGYRDNAGTTGTCPTQSYDQYTQSGPDGNFKLCLMMNGNKGDCFNGYSTKDEWKTKVDCSGADVIVTKRLNGKVDPSVCPPSSGWQLIYPMPGRTLCLDPLHNQ